MFAKLTDKTIINLGAVATADRGKNDLTVSFIAGGTRKFQSDDARALWNLLDGSCQMRRAGDEPQPQIARPAADIVIPN